jgi:predicted amidohydrolase
LEVRLDQNSSSHSRALNVVVCQLTSTDDVEANFAQINALLDTVQAQAAQDAAAVKPDLICFPENALFFRIQELAKIQPIDLATASLIHLKDRAHQMNCAIHLGSVPVGAQGQVYSTSVLLRPDGRVEIDYQKIHLFDVDVNSPSGDSSGSKRIRESDVFRAGQKPNVFEINGWKIGSSICYDLRFAELYLEYARAAVDVILVPSAFLVSTGRAHWEILLRARAIESQAYVLAAAQGGTHLSQDGIASRSTYGHAMIVDPWGVILAEVTEEAEAARELSASSGQPAHARFLRCQLERARLENVRQQIPMQQHRRLGVT